MYKRPFDASSKTAKQEALKAYQEELPDILRDFQPELIIISAGFDAYRYDPLGNFKWDDEDYDSITHIIRELAQELCGGKVVSLLEGGYNLKAIGRLAVRHIDLLANGGL